MVAVATDQKFAPVYTFAKDATKLARAHTAFDIKCQAHAANVSYNEMAMTPDEQSVAQQYGHQPLRSVITDIMDSLGFIVDGADATSVAKAFMGDAYALPHVRGQAGGLNTIRSLDIITQDAVNKSLLAGYDEAPPTWMGPGRQAASVPDFKSIHRTKLSGVPELDDWPANSSPNEVALSDEEEVYGVEAKSQMVSFDWQMFLTNDLSFISRIPFLLGQAARRTINARFWDLVKRNPMMADGQPLFSDVAGRRFQSNILGAQSLNLTALANVRANFRGRRGLNIDDNLSDAYIEINPRYLVVGSALETTAEQLVLSAADPAGLHNSTFNFARQMKHIVEPRLDDEPSGRFYVFGDGDRIEVTFLEGQEKPVTFGWTENRSLARCFSIVQTFGIKAIDWRSAVRVG